MLTDLLTWSTYPTVLEISKKNWIVKGFTELCFESYANNSVLKTNDQQQEDKVEIPPTYMSVSPLVKQLSKEQILWSVYLLKWSRENEGG